MSKEQDQQTPKQLNRTWSRANAIFLSELTTNHEKFSSDNIMRYTDGSEQDAFDEGVKEGIALALSFLSTRPYRCSRDYDRKLRRSKKTSSNAVGMSLVTSEKLDLGKQYIEHITSK